MNEELRTAVNAMLDDIARFANTTWRTGGTPFYRDELWIPPEIKASIDGHVIHGRATGSFVEAVLGNDLDMVIAKVDERNYIMLGAILGYCHAHLPLACWGSHEKVIYWRRNGGWNKLFPERPIASVEELRRNAYTVPKVQ